MSYIKCVKSGISLMLMRFGKKGGKVNGLVQMTGCYDFRKKFGMGVEHDFVFMTHNIWWMSHEG